MNFVDEMSGDEKSGDKMSVKPRPDAPTNNSILVLADEFVREMTSFHGQICPRAQESKLSVFFNLLDKFVRERRNQSVRVCYLRGIACYVE